MKWAIRVHIPVSLWIALVFSVPGVSQTTTDQPQDVLHSDQTLRTNTRLVVVDVVAIDSKGQPVPDLKPADFTLLEDGKPQKISGFNFEHPGDYHTSERGIETTLNQLNALAKVLAGYPGRKNLIWLSESFPLTLYPESMGQGNFDGQSLKSAGQSGVGQSVNQNLQRAAPFKSYATLVKKVSDSL